MQRSVWVRTFSSPACVHAIDSSDDDGSHRSAMADDESSRKKMNKKVTRLLLPLKHRRRVVSRALRSLSWGATKTTKEEEPNNNNNNKDGGQTSDAETTFVSAHSSELRSSSTDVDDDSSEPPSFRLSPPPIFPLGSIERRPPASPVKIMCKLPFGYVVGRQLDVVPAPPPPPSMTALARKIKKVVPAMAALHLRSRSQMVRKKVGRALNEACRQGRREGAEEPDNGCGGNVDDDEDVFSKKDVRGLRCRVEDDDDPY